MNLCGDEKSQGLWDILYVGYLLHISSFINENNSSIYEIKWQKDKTLLLFVLRLPSYFTVIVTKPNDILEKYR